MNRFMQYVYILIHKYKTNTLMHMPFQRVYLFTVTAELVSIHECMDCDGRRLSLG